MGSTPPTSVRHLHILGTPSILAVRHPVHGPGYTGDTSVHPQTTVGQNGLSVHATMRTSDVVHSVLRAQIEQKRQSDAAELWCTNVDLHATCCTLLPIRTLLTVLVNTGRIPH